MMQPLGFRGLRAVMLPWVPTVLGTGPEKVPQTSGTVPNVYLEAGAPPPS